jgi:hypothetical protein
MLTLTWFGFLPGNTSRNIYENREASNGERKKFCRPDLEMVQRSSRLEGVSFKDLYFVRRVGYQGLDQDFTWIAKCESIRDSMQDRVGPYRGAGLLLSGTTISGQVAYTVVKAVFDCMTHHVPDVLPRGFKLADVVQRATAKADVGQIIKAVGDKVRAEAIPHQEGAGLSLATGAYAVGIVDISGLSPESRPGIIAKFLDNAQTRPQYSQFGEIYISAEPHVIAAAMRIPNAQIIPLDWDPQPSKTAAIAPAPQSAPSDIQEDEEMSDQKLQQLRDYLMEQMRGEAAEQANLQIRSLERRLMHDSQEGVAQSSGVVQEAQWPRLLGWLAAAAAVVGISVSLSVYLRPRGGSESTVNVGEAVAAAITPIKAASDEIATQVTSLTKRLEAVEKRLAAPPVAPVQASGPSSQKLSDNSIKAAQKVVVKMLATANEIETMVSSSQGPLQAEVKRISDGMRQSVPAMCRQLQMTDQECVPPPPAK